jgi:predicted metal-dependent hydrolase
VSGETFRYLGRGHKLLVRKAQNEPRVLLKQGTLTVLSIKPEDSKMTRRMLEDWFRQRAEVIFDERLDLCFANFHHRSKPKLVVRRLKRRWGSYLRRGNRIHLNLDLIKANKMQIDYVITHELCHIEHPHHDRSFFRSLEAKLPDWPRIKRRLELDTFGRN